MKKTVSIFLTSLIICSLYFTGCSAAEKGDALVETTYGTVQGEMEDGVEKYLGVPFAAPPVGDLRFAPPAAPSVWDGVLQCTDYQDAAVQVVHKEGLSYSEDCLYLNLWAPPKGENLPVYVFIHGGAYVMGSPSDPFYDGTVFAKDGIIQVNVTYRMSALGFLPTKEEEEAYGYLGNMGTLDQIAALQWIKENIAAFGGDPNNITIGGESAGAFSVSNLIESPLAKGLFQRAILESGNLLGQPIAMSQSAGSKEQAYKLGEEFMRKIGAKTLIDLRKMDAQALVDASFFSPNVMDPALFCFWPVFDGKVIPEDPYTAMMEGTVNDVDILAGYNTDEGEDFVPEGTTEEQYIEFVNSIFGEQANLVLARFPVNAQHTATDRARYIFKVGLRSGSEIFADALSSRGKNVYYYNFDFVPPSMAAEGKGAIHALELFFVFKQPPDDAAETKAMAEDIHARWANFIKNGDPNKGVAVGVEWPRYTTEKKETLILSEAIHVAPLPEQEDEAFFRELLLGKLKGGS